MDDFSDLTDDDFGFEDNNFASDFSSDLPSSDSLDDTDDFDQLRRSSARSETMYNELSEDDFIDERGDSDSDEFSLSSFSPGQRIVLAILVVLNILMIGFGVLVLAGVVG